MKNTLSVKLSILTQERVKKVYDYNAETGKLTYKIQLASNTPIGKEAGTIKDHGYRVVRVDNIEYLAHRLIWLYMTGQWPKNQIDHIDLNKSNNTWNNLREATVSQNGINAYLRKTNKTGHKGIALFQNKWYRARIHYNGKEIHLGIFKTIDEAIAVRNAKEKELYGEYSRVQP